MTTANRNPGFCRSVSCFYSPVIYMLRENRYKCNALVPILYHQSLIWYMREDQIHLWTTFMASSSLKPREAQQALYSTVHDQFDYKRERETDSAFLFSKISYFLTVLYKMHCTLELYQFYALFCYVVSDFFSACVLWLD